MMTERIRYRMVALGDDKPTRVRVVLHHGFEGYVVRWTESCSGCFEGGEYGGLAGNYPWDAKAQCHVGGGCHECGYSGKRRYVWWMPFDHAAFERWTDARWERRERLLAFWRRKERDVA